MTMKTNEEVLEALSLCERNFIKGECEDCPYRGEVGCFNILLKDAEGALSLLLEERREMMSLTENAGGDMYWQRICKLNAKQELKGMNKYGVKLEDNTTLTAVQRVEHLQEELLDGLKYCEHLKAVLNDGISANDYQRAAMRTAGDDESSYLLNGVMGLCGEAGEVIDAVKKHLHQGHELDPLKIVEELGDCLWYVALVAEAVGATLSEVMERNIEKLMKRYPEGFSKERSVNRDKD